VGAVGINIQSKQASVLQCKSKTRAKPEESESPLMCGHHHGWRNLFQSGGHKRNKKTEKFCGLNWQLWRH